MSKLSFRARALDPSKPMPVYMSEELPDLPDFSAINRAVPQMPTGMQKEEESEHHLQRAICAGLIIPTPEVTDVPLKDFYDRVYPSNYKQPRQLIHMQPFTMEQEIPDYDMDSEDERWLQSQKPRLDISPLKFEEMMDRLEKSSGQTVVTVSEAKALLKEDDELTIAVFDYWLNKRLKTQHPLILTVRTEHRSGTAVNNPYLAFRRRTEKMQTRKNRKNDEVSYEKMLKLRRDLVRAVTLLELVKRREKCKREFVHLTVEVFEKRFQARDYSGTVAAEAAAAKAASAPPRPAFTPIFHNHNSSWVDVVSTQAQAAVHHNKSSIKDEVISRREKRQYKKRKHKSLGGRSSAVGLEGLSSDDEGSLGGATGSSGVGGASIRGVSPEPEEQEDNGPFAFRRNRLCSYHKPLPTLGNWPWCSREENGAADKRFRFTLTSLSNRKCVGFARRRVGRGGRIILDRVSTGYDDFWRGLDFTIIEPTVESTGPSSVETSNGGSTLSDPLMERLKSESVTLRTETNSSTYNKYSAVSSGSQRDRPPVNSVRSDALKISDGLTNVPTSGDVTTVVKTELVDVEMDGTDISRDEDSTEFWTTVKQQWLHFRPKTPAPDYEPPCNLLPPDDLPFANVPLPPFQMEVEPLEPPSNSNLFVDHALSSRFTSEVFELDSRWSDEGSANSGPQGPIFEEEESPEENETMSEERNAKGGSGGAAAKVGWKTVGVSSFTLKEAGREVDVDARMAAEERKEKRRRNGKDEEEVEMVEEVQGVGTSNTNGLLLPQLEFGSDAVSNLRNSCKKVQQQYAYGNPGTLSLLTSAQTVTLNSHSANNILEFPLTATMDSAGSAPASNVVVSNNSNQKTPNGGGVRNNKSNLVMEVT